MNSYSLVGKISFLEFKQGKNGCRFATFTLYSKDTSYLRCVCFEEINFNLKNHDEVVLLEYIPRRTMYVDKNGTKKYNYEILVKDFEVIETSNKGQDNFVHQDTAVTRPMVASQAAEVQETVEWDLPPQNEAPSNPKLNETIILNPDPIVNTIEINEEEIKQDAKTMQSKDFYNKYSPAGVFTDKEIYELYVYYNQNNHEDIK